MLCISRNTWDYHLDSNGKIINCQCEQCKRVADAFNPTRPHESELDGPRGMFAEQAERLREITECRDEENRTEEAEMLRLLLR